jgi:hypothetical protein
VQQIPIYYYKPSKKYSSRDTIPFIWLQYFNLRALCEKKLIGQEAVQPVRAYIESFEAVLGTQARNHARNNIFLRSVPLRGLYFSLTCSVPEMKLVKLQYLAKRSWLMEES